MTWLKKNKEALEAISRVRSLELKAREVAEGVLIGLHRSRHRGSSIEFSEHKPYSPGDELRLLDWKLFAKTDRYFIKQFEDETRVQSYLVLDASGSMNYPRTGAEGWNRIGGKALFNKFEYGRILAGALGYLLLGQGDSAGTVLLSQGRFNWLPARSGERHFLSIIEFLSGAEPEGETDLSKIFLELASRVKKKSLFILFSDFFDEENELLKSLRLTSHLGNELVLFQILAKEEVEFPFARLSWFEGLENEGKALIEPKELRARYLKLFNDFCKNLRQVSNELGADYQVFRTEDNPAQMLSSYLLKRAESKRRLVRG